MTGSQFADNLRMDAIEVGESVGMHNGAKFNKVALRGARIGNSILIYDTSLSFLDLTGPKIGSELKISSSSNPPTTARWTKNAKLILRNTQVDSLEDLPESWPDKLDLNGFIYNTLSDIGNRNLSDLKNWLNKSAYFSQSYKQLASVLRKAGYHEKANDILYARKEKERQLANFPLNWGLYLQKIFIGYGIGYRYFYTIIWVFFFVRFGVGVLRYFGDDTNHRIELGHAYSLDMLLPIIRLRESHYDIELSEHATKYFYFHKIMGYVLAFFLIAGLSGMTE
jgi:hypothetical protein